MATHYKVLNNEPEIKQFGSIITKFGTHCAKQCQSSFKRLSYGFQYRHYTILVAPGRSALLSRTADPGHLSIRIKHIVVGQLTAVVTAPKSAVQLVGLYAIQYRRDRVETC
ncbi:hypothetical protein NQ317_010659 [Molorchus minor]|uniref:Uncharacterized protein n=1 Tax=Molorchus minor TaxID=1323400 RepID=A0ABQ9K790_9CUCU|nr:hypothetical protein NQ317_010659 [Molorchus minor]